MGNVPSGIYLIYLDWNNSTDSEVKICLFAFWWAIKISETFLAKARIRLGWGPRPYRHDVGQET
jgi:hypothetical protein